MIRKTWMLPLGIVSAVVMAAFAVVIVRANADDMLYNAARLMTEVKSGHAIVDFTVETPEENGTGTVELWGRWDSESEAPAVFRMEVLSASKPEAVGTLLVSDGTQFWMYNPMENKVLTGTKEEMHAAMEAKMADYKAKDEGFAPDEYDRPETEAAMPETPEEMVDKLLEYFTAERNGREAIGSYDANKLRMIPIPEQIPEEMRANGGLLNVWLRVGDDAPLAAEYTGGAVGYAKAVATTLDLNVDLDESLFTFVIPEGAEVVNAAELEMEIPTVTMEEAEALTDFDVLTPDSLAIPARLVDVTEVRGAVVQRFKTPDGSFTVAQGAADAAPPADADATSAVTVRGVEGQLSVNEDNSRALVSWTEGDVAFWVGGDLSAEDALAIANSLQ